MPCKVVNNKNRNWDKLLGVLFAYRSTPHQSTGETPFYLLYGRRFNLPTALDLTVPVLRFPVVESDYSQAQEKELTEARAFAKRNVEAAQRHQKKYYDHEAKDSELKIGCKLNVSRQQLSKFGEAISSAKPWVGSSGKLWKR